jgi:tetratricopeptide (TPR) repeat protein
MNRFIPKILIWFCLIACTHVYGQTKNTIDSLQHIVRTSRDTSKVEAYNQLSYEFRNSDSEFSLVYADSAINYAKKIKYIKGIGGGYINKGNYYKITGDNANARACYIWAYVQHNNIGNKKGIASALNAFAGLHFLQGNLTQALTYFIKSLTLSEEIGDRRGVAITLNNIGVINLEQRNYSKALEYYERSYHTLKELGDYSSMADALINIGNIYHTQGILDESLKYYNHALEAKKSVGDEKGRSTVLNNIGLVYSEQGNIDAALKYYHQSLSIDERLKDIQSITISCHSISQLYYKTGMLFAAKKYSLRALELEKQQNDRIDMVNTYDLLSRIDDKLGNYKEALEYYKYYTAYRDSLYSEEQKQRLENIEAQYHAEKSENDRLIQTLGKTALIDEESIIENQITRNIIITALVLLGFLALVYLVFFVIRKNK